VGWTTEVPHDEIAFLTEAGFIYRDAHRFTEAEEVFRGVQALLPASEMPSIAIGTVRFEQGDLAAAIAQYERALKQNEQSALAHAHLGEAHLFRRETDKARDHLKRALQLEPRGETAKFARGLLELLEITSK